MKLAAYFMAADPSWLRASLASYYGIVDRIFVSYDVNHLGWTGRPVPVQRCLELARKIDTDGKITELPGEFWRPDFDPMANDTHQRQVTLDAASQDADWVLHLDTDEIVLDPAAFTQAIATADENGRDGLEYPARCMYAWLGSGRYLEQSTRFGRLSASYPGTVAIRAGTRLNVARHGPASSRLWRIDFRRQNTDTAHAPGTRVDAQVRADQAILHLSWVRSEADLRSKGGSSGHAHDFDWSRAVTRWSRRQRHPYLTTLTSPLRRGAGMQWLRLGSAKLSLPPGADERTGDGWREPGQRS
jgi:hypothetical protein